MSKLISTFQIRFDDETKAEIAALKGKLDVVAHRLNVGHAMPTGGLLAVMAGEAANDSNSAIDRETINDVDYLSTSLDESVPYIDNAVEQNYWLSPSVPKITDTDMQLIFIKNLSEILIQRMHSMDRFSEDDYAVGGDKLMPWDIVANPKGDFGVITGHNQDKRYFGGFYLVPYARGNHAKTIAGERANEYLKTLEFCTITEDQIPAFRSALEACYA